MATYKQIIIYYFSGTGNSKNVASWFSKVAIDRGIECKLINIANTDRLNIDLPPTDSLIVFASPIHGFNYPPVMLHFISRFPKGKNNVVLMNTRAGMLIGKFVTPGLTGVAFYFSTVVLKFKGYSIQGMLPVDLPSNWMSLHPSLNDRTIKFLHEKNKERVTSFAREILDGKSYFKYMREMLLDIVVTPISLLYYFIGRFVIAKTFYASADCNNCGLCIKNCPVKAIIRVNDRPFWTFKCESCMNCMSHCPKRSIETGHGFLFLILLLSSFLIERFFYNYFELNSLKTDHFLLSMIIESLVYIGIITVSYRLMHFLLRFRLFERLMVYTSFTKFKFWGKRYKALDEKV